MTPTSLLIVSSQITSSADEHAQCSIALPETGLTAIENGDGPDVIVLVHGALGDYRHWAAIGARLCARYRVVAVSRRFHWPNPAPSPDVSYTYEDHRDDLLQLVRWVAHPVHLVGHSYGAGVALLAALREPELVRSLTLIEPAFNSLLPKAAPGLRAELASRNSMVAKVRSLVHAGDHRRAVERFIDWAQGGAGGFAKLPHSVKEGLLANASTVGLTFASEVPNLTSDHLCQLGVSTLVLNGEHTRLFYRLIGHAMVSCIPGAKAGDISGAAHMSIVERPIETVDMMLPFLAQT